MKPICRTNRRPFRPGFLSHLRSSNGYDGPEILPSSTRHFYLIGADAGHISLHAVETTWCFWTTNTADSRATNVVVTIVDGPVVGYAQPL